MTHDVAKDGIPTKCGEADVPDDRNVFGGPISSDPFWRLMLNSGEIPGTTCVPHRVANAVAALVGDITGHYAPSSECKAVVALIALANAKYDLAIFRRDVALHNLEILEQRPCNERDHRIETLTANQ